MKDGLMMRMRDFGRRAAFMAVLCANIACTTTGGASRTVNVDGRDMSVDEAARPHYETGIERRDAGDVTAAKASFETVLDLYPDSSWADLATIALAEIHLDEEQPAQAQKLVENLLLANPASAVAERARYLLALSQLDQGNPEEATGQLEKSIERIGDPQQKKEATAELSEALREKQPSQAAKYAQQALELTDDPEERKEREEKIVALVDDDLPFAEVRRLAETEAAPGTVLDEITLYKLARIHLHLRDERSAHERLTQYKERYPAGRFIDEVRVLDEQLEKRVQVAPTTIGVVLPLTGNYKSYGQRALTAVLLGAGIAVDDKAYADEKSGEGIYERKLEKGGTLRLVVKDSAGDPEVAAAKVQELVEQDHAIAAVGDILLDTSLPAALRAEEYGIPLLSLSRREGLATLGPWTFRLSFTAKKQAKALASLAVDKLGFKRFAILYPRHSYGIELMNVFWDEVEKRQGEVTAIESYGHDQTTFTDEIRSMVGRAHLEARYEFNVCKNKAKEIDDPYRQKKALEGCQSDVSPIVDFDALLIPDDYRTVSYILPAFQAEDVLLTKDKYKIAVFKKTTENRRSKPVQLLGGNMWNDPELGNRLGRNIDGALFVDGFYPRSDEGQVKKFVKAFADVHHSRPGLLEAQAHDAGALLAAILGGGAGAPPGSRVQLRDQLARTKDFPGVTGLVTFDEHGDSATPPTFFTFDKGRLEVAEDEDLQGEGEG